MANSGLPINVSHGVVRTEARGIFVSNLPLMVYRTDIEEHFRRAGTIVHVEMVTDAKTGRFKGIAIIRYASSAEAQLAIEMFHETQWSGRVLQLRRDKEQSVVTPSRSWAAGGGSDESTRTSSSNPSPSVNRRTARLEHPLIVDGSRRR